MEHIQNHALDDDKEHAEDHDLPQITIWNTIKIVNGRSDTCRLRYVAPEPYGTDRSHPENMRVKARHMYGSHK